MDKRIFRGILATAVSIGIVAWFGGCEDITPTVDAVAPSISAQPQDAGYTQGGSASALSVTASVSDGGTLSYQWYSNTGNSTSDGTIINGQILSTYTPNISTIGITYYYVVVTNTNNSATGTKTNTAISRAAKITVTAIADAGTPIISVEPQDASYTQEGSASALSVTASVSDDGTLSYQWYSNTGNSTSGGTPIGGQTLSTYTPNVSTIGITYYYVVVTNTNSSINGTKTNAATSRAAKIIVLPTGTVITDAAAPSISIQPQDANYTQGGSVTALSITASVSDGGTLSYQWYSNTSNSTSNGTIINGAISNTYTPNISAAGETYYYVIVTNTNNSVNGINTKTAISRAAKITVAALINAATPSINTQPQDAGYTQGGSVTALSVTASVSDGGTLSYQWYSNTSNSTSGGTPIQGQTGRTYTPNISAVGETYYYVVVTNTNNSVNGTKINAATSRAAKITVAVLINAATPSISAQPQSAIYIKGSTASALSVTASVSDGGTLSYQWYSNTSNSTSNGTIINGAISNTYTPDVSTQLDTYYYVVITNTNNSVNGTKTETATSSVIEIEVIEITNNPSGDGDTWSAVTNLSQVDGTWKGSYTTIGDAGSGMKLTTSTERTFIFNASAQTIAASGTTTKTYSGGSINSTWGSIKQSAGSGWSFNDANHSMTKTTDQPAASVPSERWSILQINQNSTKIRLPFEIGNGSGASITLWEIMAKQ